MKSKKTIIGLGIGILAVIGIGLYVVRSYVWIPPTPEAKVSEVVKRDDLGFSFAYVGGEEGYSFVEPPLTDEMKVSGIQSAFILLKANEYAEYRAREGEVGEAPRSISVFVVKEMEDETSSSTEDIDRMTKVRLWAEANSVLTGYNRKRGEPTEVIIDGVKGIRYEADGLYPQDTYITFLRNTYYVFVGQFDGPGDPRRVEFDTVVRSILFL